MKQAEKKTSNWNSLGAKPYHKNPRTINDLTLEAIKENIQELGDLSGIILDLNTKEVISGNQRSRIIDINSCKVTYTKKFDEPTKQGTVALGYVEWEGQYLSYREVRWTDKQREKANITANTLSGKWDVDILLKNFNIQDLQKYAVPGDILQKMMEQDKQFNLTYGNAKYPIVPVFSEKYDYVLIMATNDIEIAWLSTFFQLQTEKSYKKQTIGIGRVVTFEKFKSLVTNGEDKKDIPQTD